MGKKDKDQEFDINQIPDDDAAVLFDENELSDDQEPDEDDSDNSAVDEDETDESQSDDDDDDDQDEDDFSDLGLDDDEADGKSKTSKGKKVPDKFKGKSAEDIAEAYTNLEKEFGRLRNEIAELKKGKNDGDKDKGGEGDDVEKVDLTKVFNVEELNELILSSDRPGEVILQTIAASFNALQEGAVKSISKIIEDKDKFYREKYFNEIDQSRAEREAMKPYVKKAEKMRKKYGAEWDALIPYMEKAINNNPNLVKEPDDYETLFERTREWAKSRGKLQEIADKNHRAKKAGGFSATGRHKGGELADDDQQAVLSALLGT